MMFNLLKVVFINEEQIAIYKEDILNVIIFFQIIS
jgi:hypothetical protein